MPLDIFSIASSTYWHAKATLRKVDFYRMLENENNERMIIPGLEGQEDKITEALLLNSCTITIVSCKISYVFTKKIFGILQDFFHFWVEHSLFLYLSL